MVKKCAIALSLCVLLASGRYLLAQEESTGPLDFSVKLGIETTDNRDSAPDGFEESNTDVMLTPRVDALFNMERTFLDFYYAPTLLYRSNARADENDQQFYHDLGLNLRHALTPRLTFKLGEHFNLTDDPSVDQGGTMLRRDSTFTINRVNAGLVYDISRMSRVEVTGRHRKKTYDESTLSYLDEESVAGGASVYRAMSRTITILGEAEVENFTYQDNVVGEGVLTGGGSTDRGYTSTSVGVGMENEFRNNCRASVRAGFTQLDYADESIDSQSSPYVQALLKVAAVPSARFTGSATYRLRDSDVFPFASQKYTEVFAGVELDATARVTVDASAAYRLGQYEEDSLPAGRRAQLESADQVLTVYGQRVDSPSGDETAVIVKAGVSFEVSDNTVIKLSQQYEDVESDVSTSFTRNATRLTLLRSF